MTPSFSGKVLKNYDIPIGKFSEIGIQDEGCPPGMVPIMKIKSNQQRNINSLTKSHSKNFRQLDAIYPYYQVSFLFICTFFFLL